LVKDIKNMAPTKPGKKDEFPITGWKWIFYILGWLHVLGLLFWAVQLIVYLRKHNGEKFFSSDFYRVVFYFGIATVVVFVFLLGTITLIYLAAPITFNIY
jgi:hypothetical protein